MVSTRHAHFYTHLEVGRNKLVRVTARTGVSGKHLPNLPETPPRAMRLDGLIPAYILTSRNINSWFPSSAWECSLTTLPRRAWEP